MPTLKVDLFTLNFGDATDSKASEEFVFRNDIWTIGNHLWIVPPRDTDPAVRKSWLKFAAPLPKEDLGYKERLAFSDAREIVEQDNIQVGGDTGDIEAACAEQEPDRFREQKEKDPSLGQAHIICLPSIFEDEQGWNPAAGFLMNSAHS